MILRLWPSSTKIIVPPTKAGGNSNASNKFNNLRETIFFRATLSSIYRTNNFKHPYHLIADICR